MKNLKFLGLAILLSLPLVSDAGVSLKNGNFYVTYIDLIIPGGGNELMVRRTYNSRSPERGWFGNGWGSDYETFLASSPDGSVTIYENGAGAPNRFVPEGNIDVAAASKKIIDAIRAKSTMDQKSADNLMKSLQKDEELRILYARRYNIEADLKVGTVLKSNTHGLQTLEKTKTGYTRKHNDGRVDLFDNEGKLLKMSDKSGYAVTFEYKGKVLASLKDSKAKQIFFDWFPSGRVKRVHTTSGAEAVYKYDDRTNNLVESKDAAGNVYKFAYDAKNNLSKVSYSDKTEMTIKYDKNQFASEVKSRDGEITKYKYESNSKNPELHYWTTVTSISTPGAKPVVSKYEYENKLRADGSQYTYRNRTEFNGHITETIYADQSNLPIKITNGKDITTFEYNKNGLLTKKTSSRGDSIELSYHEKFNKITKVKDRNGITDFTYDNRGFLSKAVNSSGSSVLISYDRNGKIIKMIDQNSNLKTKKVLSFIYNAMGKPIEIGLEGVGKINVVYDNNGDIKKVDSAKGPEMAMQVTESFQNLLAIVKPAGVSLGI